MEDTMGMQRNKERALRAVEIGYSSEAKHKQEEAMRAIEAVAISGFVKNSRSLQESCLVICNLCRECVPLPKLRIGVEVPSTLLALIWPALVHAEGESASRVLRHKRVLKLGWELNDPAVPHVVKREAGGSAKEEEGEEEEEEEEDMEEEHTKAETKRRAVTACDIDVSKVRWPTGLKEISLGRFNRPVGGVVWPECLEVLSFHMPSRVYRGDVLEFYHRGIFNRPLDGASFPAGLREIFLGCKFNQRIDNVDWPKGLERLSLPGFNQPIHGVQWPVGLSTLEFSKPYQFKVREFSNEVDRQYVGFDQPLGAFLPKSLETLWLSDTFDQPLRGITWPNGLAVLGLGTDLTKESVNGVEWPPSLRKLVISNDVLDTEDAPPDCEVVLVDLTGDSDSNGSDGDEWWLEAFRHRWENDSLDSSRSL